MTVRYLTGDVREVMATIPDGSVSLVASSPPFLALRSYLPADADGKHAEIGSEANPAQFIDTLLGLTAEWGRVLAPWGSLAIELGDSYSGSGGAGGDYNAGGLREGQGKFDGTAARQRTHYDADITYGDRASGFAGTGGRWGQRLTTGGPGWPQAKSLALIPQLYAASLAYGFNVLRRPMTAEQVLWWIDELRGGGMSAEAALAMVGGWVAAHPEPSPAGRWLVRNVVVWHRPNPAVGGLGDKYRPSTSYIVVATRDSKRWFDLTAVRSEASPNTHARTAKGVASRQTTGKSADRDGNYNTLDTLHLGDGGPPLDTWFDEWDGTHETWTLTTQPSKLAHYAMWPAKLAERLVLSMCPALVCDTCGEPRRRVEKVASHGEWRRPELAHTGSNHGGPGTHGDRTAASVTLGWTDCGHDNYQPGVTLDPFAGTGTTLAVAHLHGRNAIGIDLDTRNRELYPRRLDECRRALFGTKPEMAGQLDMFGEGA